MKMLKLLFAIVGMILVSSCAHEYNQVYKINDTKYQYEFAKELYARGKYAQATELLNGLVTVLKGTEYGQECLYTLAMSEYNSRNYETASTYFKKYYSSYPRGIFAEQASFYTGQSLFKSTPEPRLDQTATVMAIAAFQEYLDLFPHGTMVADAQKRLFELQDKLVEKELLSAQLYYNLGSYFGNCTSDGNNYEACIVTSQNAIDDYPYTSLREEFAALIMKSRYRLAEQSVESKKIDRYREAEDECYGFINEYPESKERHTAEKYIEACRKVLKD